jgi:hypothetical protein
MAYHRGGCEVSAREGICKIIGMQIIYYSADNLAAPCEANSAFFVTGSYVKLIIRIGSKIGYIAMIVFGISHVYKLTLTALTAEYRVYRVTFGKPFKMYSRFIRYYAAHVYVTNLREGWSVWVIAPVVVALHNILRSFICT